MFDLATLAQSDSALMTVRHPGTGEELTDDEGKLVTVKLAGPGHPRYVQHRNRALRRSLRRARLNADIDDPAEVVEYNTQQLVDLTLDWHGIALDGEVLACTPENVKRVYDDNRFAWLKTQVNDFVGRESSFITGSATRS